MDKNTYNLLYNISKTLSENGEYCSKNGCSFNSDFLNADSNDQSSFQKKIKQMPEQKQPEKNDTKEDENDFEFSDVHGPVLGSGLVSGKN